jgi:hypothetical protein
MAIPDFQSLTLPVLREFGDGLEHSTKDIRQRVAEGLRLRPDELAEMLPSGGQTRFANRVAWAHVCMKQAGLLTSIRRGVYRITPRGAEVLASPPDQITMQFLERYPEYLDFRARQASVDVSPQRELSGDTAQRREPAVLTPDEQINDECVGRRARASPSGSMRSEKGGSFWRACGPVCIVGPALSALDQGFDVYVIADACGDISAGNTCLLTKAWHAKLWRLRDCDRQCQRC